MLSLSTLGRYLERRSQRKGYQATRAVIESLSERDLADIGVKRHQLGHEAQRLVF